MSADSFLPAEVALQLLSENIRPTLPETSDMLSKVVPCKVLWILLRTLLLELCF